MAISKKSWTGFAVESPAGTAAGVSTVYHPCKSKMTNATKFVYVTEDRGARDANNKRLGTVRMAKGDISGDWYNDTGVYLLLGFMGHTGDSQPDAVNAPTAYQHALTLVDTPPALTLFKGYDVAGYYFSYTIIEKLAFEFAADGKLLTYNAGVQSRYGVKSGSVATPTYSNEPLWAGYVPTLKFNTVASTVVESVKLEFEQKIELFYPINGSRDYIKAYYGDRSAKVSFDASFEDDTLYQRFLTEQDDHFSVDFIGQLYGSGPSTVHEALSFDFPIIGYDDMELDTSKEHIQVKAKATARPGTSLNSTFTANVINTIASYAS